MKSPARDKYRRNLLLLHSRDQQALSDWQTVQSKIEARASDIEVRIDSNDEPDPATARWQVSRPSLVFSPLRLLAYRPPAGKVYVGQAIGKIEEWRRLADAGLPIPLTTRLTPDISLDPEQWGGYVVVKPVAGLRAQFVRLIRTRDAALRFAELTDNARRRMLVQKFIDNLDQVGRPHSYRCLTMFGRTLYMNSYNWLEPRGSLDEIATGNGRIATTDREAPKTEQLEEAADIIALSARVAAAFPEIPCLGQDWVRDRVTGEPFILETNPAGAVWHLSSTIYREKCSRGPDYLESRYHQFHALDVVADLLIERTRAEAC